MLIDPAAHGGHGLTDIAMLALFGTEHLDRVQAGYADAAGLAANWPELIGLHQLHPLLVHAVSHGPSYGRAGGQDGCAVRVKSPKAYRWGSGAARFAPGCQEAS